MLFTTALSNMENVNGTMLFDFYKYIVCNGQKSINFDLDVDVIRQRGNFMGHKSRTLSEFKNEFPFCDVSYLDKMGCDDENTIIIQTTSFYADTFYFWNVKNGMMCRNVDYDEFDDFDDEYIQYVFSLYFDLF